MSETTERRREQLRKAAATYYQRHTDEIKWKQRERRADERAKLAMLEMSGSLTFDDVSALATLWNIAQSQPAAVRRFIGVYTASHDMNEGQSMNERKQGVQNGIDWHDLGI